MLATLVMRTLTVEKSCWQRHKAARYDHGCLRLRVTGTWVNDVITWRHVCLLQPASIASVTRVAVNHSTLCCEPHIHMCIGDTPHWPLATTYDIILNNEINSLNWRQKTRKVEDDVGIASKININYVFINAVHLIDDLFSKQLQRFHCKYISETTYIY